VFEDSFKLPRVKMASGVLMIELRNIDSLRITKVKNSPGTDRSLTVLLILLRLLRFLSNEHFFD